MSQAKVALVTGASSGIGKAIADRLAADGFRVFGTARKPARDDVDGIAMLPLDVTNDRSVAACVKTVIDRGGQLDVVVNNAGYLLAGAVEEATIDQAKAQLETNFFGVVRMTQAVLPHMRERKAGHLITISSLAGLVPVPFWGYYNASKFAVEGLLETLRHEVRPFGIQVAMVEPGAIKTPFYAQPSATPMPAYARWREPALGAMAEFERKAPGPDLVAAKVSQIARTTKPKLRHRVTREAKMFSFLRWLLPAGAFEAGVRSGFKIPK
jgi:NAD(P)-dependent dehydrogenase (short-subunit alcohol dehydrogenase family)